MAMLKQLELGQVVERRKLGTVCDAHVIELDGMVGKDAKSISFAPAHRSHQATMTGDRDPQPLA